MAIAKHQSDCIAAVRNDRLPEVLTPTKRPSSDISPKSGSTKRKRMMSSSKSSIRGVLGSLVAFAAISAEVHAQATLKPQDQAGRLFADMQDCSVDKPTTDLVSRKLTDWIRHVEHGGNTLTCTPDPKCSGLSPEVATAFLCARIPCDKGPPPAAKPDCRTFIPRLKSMKLLRDDWRPADGLR